MRPLNKKSLNKGGRKYDADCTSFSVAIKSCLAQFGPVVMCLTGDREVPGSNPAVA